MGFIKFVTENGVNLSQFFSLFILILPWILLFIIPVSMLFSVIVTFNKMISANEITILKNSGLNKIQISRPIFKVMALCSIICYIISFYFMPSANRQLRNTMNFLHNNYASLSFTPKTFENLNNLTIYVKNRDEKNNLFGILIHDQRSPKFSVTLTAEKGYIYSEQDSALLYMENGTIQRFKRLEKKSEIINFDNYIFSLSDNSKKPKTRSLKPRELTFFELLGYQEGISDDIDYSEIRAEIHQRIAYPLLSINLAMIGIAFILRGNFSRHGNAKNIILAIITSAIFLGIIMMLISFIAKAPQFIPALYLAIILFIIINIRMLKKN